MIAPGASAIAPPRLRSKLPGRERWDVPGLWRRPALARQLELTLAAQDGVTRVCANPNTGRLLIEYRLGASLNLSLIELIGRLKRAQPERDEEEVKPTFDEIRALIKQYEQDPQLRRKASLYSMLNAVTSLVEPLSFGLLLTTAISGGSPLLAALGLKTAVAQMATLGLGVWGVRALDSRLNVLQNEAWQEYAGQVAHQVRVAAFDKVASLDIAYLQSRQTSRLAQIIDGDSRTVRAFLESMPHAVLEKSVTLVGGGLFLVWISPTAFLLTLSSAPLMVLLFRRYHQRITRQYLARGDAEQTAGNVVANSLAGMETVKSFSRESFESERVKASGQVLHRDIAEAYNLSAAYANLTKLALVTGMVLPLAYSGVMVLNGALSGTHFMMQTFMLPQMTTIAWGLDQKYDLYHSTVGATARLQQLLACRAVMVDGEQTLSRRDVEGELVFEDVSFAYHPEKPVLTRFNLTVPARSSLALVGETGSGKSTAAKLVPRFYDPNVGRVLLDGQDLRELSLASLRELVGYVGQDVFLFDGTVFENIAYGRPGADLAAVREAARQAEALDFIEAMPLGFDEGVGERGVKLSGGQRQRISIARVMLKDPPIIIFDEATSAVDNETEAALRQSFTRLCRDRTVITIAHRMSTIREVDQICVLGCGRILERGSHEALLARNGHYAQLLALETGHPTEQPAGNVVALPMS